MILMISMALAFAFLLLCGKALRARPAPFYAGAALLSALVTGLYWLAPAFLDLQLRVKLPIFLGALGTACFILVMCAGALPNGHPLMKRIMPIRGELSIFACLLTLGHNLSYGKNYLTPGYLFSGPLSTTKAAAWVSMVLILLMLVLTITSVKSVRRRFQPRKWKALQRWAYLFYALTYLHVLLLTIPKLLKGLTYYLINLVVYSAVYLSYAVCRIQKAFFVKRSQAARVTGRRQLVGVGIGLLLTLLLTACIMLPGQLQNTDAPAEEAPPAASNNSADQTTVQPEEPSESDSAPESDTTVPPAEPSEAPVSEDTTLPDQTPEEEPAAEPASTPDATPPAEIPSAVPTPTPEPAPQPEPQPQPEPTPEPEPAPISKYKDGTFTGTGEGYDGPITVSVTISGDKITAINVTSYVDADEYMTDAKNGVIPSILLMQSTNVSAVSGATYSSEGIMDAVAAALREATN